MGGDWSNLPYSFAQPVDTVHMGTRRYKMFNRCAVTTTAKQPFKDWLALACGLREVYFH